MAPARIQKPGLSPLAALGFIAACLAIGLAAGLVWRPAFDDEAQALVLIDQLGLAELTGFYLNGGDVHAPLAFAFMKLLAMAGLGDGFIRLVNFLCAIAAFALALDTALRSLPAGRLLRAMAIMLFAACPLLYGVGDAARWYSLLALFIALALRWVIVDGLSARVGVALGLAFSTSFLAAIPVLAVMLWRYGQRRPTLGKADWQCWLAAAIFAVPGVIALINSLGNLAPQLSAGPASALAYGVIGFFGGNRLGLLPALLALPMLAWAGWALVRAVLSLARGGDAVAPQALRLLTLIMAALCLVLTVAGFDKPRSFLFLAPWLCALLALSLPVLAGNGVLRAFAYTAMLLPFFASLGSIRATERPYKRELAVPVRQIVAELEQAMPAPALVISGSPAMGYALYRRGYCVAARSLLPLCQRTDVAAKEGVIVVRDFTFDRTLNLPELRAKAIAGKKLVSETKYGTDAEAALKTRLSGVALPEWLVTVEVWR